jgi:octopine/nopaline transport system permease protein
MSLDFLAEASGRLLSGAPLTLELAAAALVLGGLFGLVLALWRLSGRWALDISARLYIFIFRGTPLLAQIFLIYYGLGQFVTIRHSFLWPILRQPYCCAVLSLALNTAAYSAEIFRGGLRSVPAGQIDAARACGMPSWTIFRRVRLPLAIGQALPAYGNEVVAMIKATSLASTITLMEITGVAAKLISDSYRAIEVFVIAGAIYLAINFIATRSVALCEYWLDPQRRGSRRREGLPA